MIFSSIPFLFLFFPIFLGIYFLVPFKAKNIILLIASLIFYAWGEPVYILLMIFSSIVDYINGLMIEKNSDNKTKQKVFLIWSICINMFMLGFFKYSDFVIININNLLRNEYKNSKFRTSNRNKFFYISNNELFNRRIQKTSGSRKEILKFYDICNNVSSINCRTNS